MLAELSQLGVTLFNHLLFVLHKHMGLLISLSVLTEPAGESSGGTDRQQESLAGFVLQNSPRDLSFRAASPAGKLALAQA